MRNIGLLMFLAIGIALIAPTKVSAQPVESITTTFNSTPIPAGSYLWFNSEVVTNGLSTTDPTTVTILDATLQVGGTTYTIPSASITYIPSSTAPLIPSTTYDPASNTWHTTMAAHLGGDVFLTGLPIQLPVGLAGGQDPVTFTARFTSDKPGISGTFHFSRRGLFADV